MPGLPQGILELDLDAVDLHKGLRGLAAIGISVIFVAAFGTVGVTAGLAALFVIVADSPGRPRDRTVGVLVVTLVGSAIALIGTWAGTTHFLVAATLIFIITVAGTISAGLGRSWAIRGLLLSIWAVIALGLAGEEQAAIGLAMAFALGGMFAAAILLVTGRNTPQVSIEVEASAATRTLESIIHSPLGSFAVLRGGAVGIAVPLGAWLFPDHPVWAALTVLLVLRPAVGETVRVGVQRTLGTIAGVLLAEGMIILGDGSDVVLLAALLAAAFAMTALQSVNYAVFVLLLTAVLVLTQELLGLSAQATASDRLLATILGALIAFGGIAFAYLIQRRAIASD